MLYVCASLNTSTLSLPSNGVGTNECTHKPARTHTHAHTPWHMRSRAQSHAQSHTHSHDCMRNRNLHPNRFGKPLHRQPHTASSNIPFWLYTTQPQVLFIHTWSFTRSDLMHTIRRSSSLSLNSYTKGMSGILRYSAMLVEGRVENTRDGRVYQALTFLPRTQLVRLSMVGRWSVGGLSVVGRWSVGGLSISLFVHVYTTWWQTYVGGFLTLLLSQDEYVVLSESCKILHGPDCALVPIGRCVWVCGCVSVWVFSKMTCMYAYIHLCI